MSYEKFVMDLDHCGMLLRMLEGSECDAEAMARDAYREAGPGLNFLSTGHTLRHYATANYQSELPEPGPYETCKEHGSPTLAERANSRWKAMLAAYEAPPIDPGIDEALTDFIARRKRETPDAWY